MSKQFYESIYEQAFVEKLQQAGWTPKFGPEVARRVDAAILDANLKAYRRSRYAEKGLTEDGYHFE